MAYTNLHEKLEEAIRLSGVQLHEWLPQMTVAPMPAQRKGTYFTTYLVALKDNPEVRIELDPRGSAEQWAEQIKAAVV